MTYFGARHLKLSQDGDARMIVQAANMSARPEHYSARGATVTDLHGEQIRQIYKNILKHHGRVASLAFVKMVMGMEQLSATDFLLNLYLLERNEWRWSPDQATDAGGNHFTCEATAFATMMGVLGGRERDETATIKQQFGHAMQAIFSKEADDDKKLASDTEAMNVIFPPPPACTHCSGRHADDDCWERKSPYRESP